MWRDFGLAPMVFPLSQARWLILGPAKTLSTG